MMEYEDLRTQPIGERIRQVRGEKSREEFASLMGVHKNTLANYERGKRNPDSEFLSTLCREEKIDPVWLLLGTKRTERPYRRELLERVATILATMSPENLGPKTGKLLVNVYERAADIEAKDCQIENIARGMLELLDLPISSAKSASCLIRDGEDRSWQRE